LSGNLFTKYSIQHAGFDSCLQWYSVLCVVATIYGNVHSYHTNYYLDCYRIWQCSPVVILLMNYYFEYSSLPATPSPGA